MYSFYILPTYIIVYTWGPKTYYFKIIMEVT